MPTRPCLGVHGKPCGRLTQRADSRCDTCASEHGKARDARRGNRHARGYGNEHDRMRQRWEPRVDAGNVDCHAVTCLEDQPRIEPGSAWDLGHDDDGQWRGPEHQRCNRSAAGKASHRHAE